MTNSYRQNIRSGCHAHACVSMIVRKTIVYDFKKCPCKHWVPLAVYPPVLNKNRSIVPTVSIKHDHHSAFTLIELLVVFGVIGLLISILIPSLGAARSQAKSVVCRSNIRQLALANSYYADEYGGVFCPGASRFLKNLHRWHGTRDHTGEAFDSARGPLVAYLGEDGEIKQCPTFPADEIASHSHGFERGNGGYGYNNNFLGVQLVEFKSGAFTVSTDRAGVYMHTIKKPGQTIMFTDSGFAADDLIEYSFAESRFHPQYPGYRAVPSIHFRHNKTANIVWCDSHVETQKMTYTRSSLLYRSDPKSFSIGWFGKADDNSLFDLK